MHLNLLHNSKLKGMSLLLAVLSWGIVKQITNNEKPIENVPVRITLPEGWAIREKDLTEVTITFQGTREALLLLDERTVQVQVDLRDSPFEKEKVIPLDSSFVTYTGSSAQIIDIQPDTLVVNLGKEGRKQLPVVVNRFGDPPEGLKVEAIETTPQIVTLYGAEELLEQVGSLQTAPLSLSDKIQTFEQRLDVLPPSEEWVGRIDPPRVRVKVTLAGLTLRREFQNIPLLLYHPATEASPGPRVAEPDTVDVFLKGSPQLLDTLDTSRIKAFVSASETPEAPVDKAVNVLVPAGLEVLAVSPPTVRLRPLRPTPTPTPSPEPAESE
jgi:YbbR domain-containing protein